jgi:hypothetical protein
LYTFEDTTVMTYSLSLFKIYLQPIRNMVSGILEVRIADA